MQYLTVDIGASSGKILRGHLKNDTLITEEVCRFPNTIERKHGHLVWDIESLAHHMIEGLKKAGPADSVSIDTWGVDFVLLDREGDLITDPVCYRDGRTKDIACPIAQDELYSRTGIQKLEFNTVYQLLALKKEDPAVLDRARTLLMIPDYLAYLLTGLPHQEYTNATTTNLVNAKARTWDLDLIERLGFPTRLFGPLSMPGSEYGYVKAEIASRIGYRPMVIAAPSHDTASAVIGSPLTPSSAFLSSGTWSLFGTLITEPLLSKEAERANFTNEGGLDGSIRLLKNLMGTWILQNLRKEWDDLPFDEIERLAKKGADSKARFDITDERLLAPESMTKTVQELCAENGPEPETRIEIAAAVYQSLALGYSKALEELEALTGKSLDHIAIVGGGSKDGYLCSLTAQLTGRRVTAGPVEGTAMGNMLSQALATGEIKDKKQLEKVLLNSIEIRQYDGGNDDKV